METDATVIIIAAFNAEKTLEKVILDIKKTCGLATIIVVDDGSTDSTQKMARSLEAITITNEHNLGLGAAIKKGVGHGLRKEAEFFVTIGADDQRDTRDILKLLQSLREKRCDIVFGSKFLLKGQDMPFVRKYGNKIITFALNTLFGSHFSDVTSGFRAFNRKIAAEVFDLSDGYTFDVDLCIKILKRNYTYTEVPVKVFYKEGTSKMKNIFTIGLAMFFVILRRRFSPN